MDKYKLELLEFRPDDEVQVIEQCQGYNFFVTAGHGYLVVPKEDYYYKHACNIAEYGYIGEQAVYLEEDSEAGEFIKSINAEGIKR